MNIGMGEEEWNNFNIKNYDYSVSSVHSVSHILSLRVVYISIQGRLSKSLLSLGKRLSCPYTELLCHVQIRGGVIVSAAQQTLAEWVEGELRSSGSAIPCWVGGVGLSWLSSSCVSQTRLSIFAESPSCRLNIVWSYLLLVLWRFSSILTESRVYIFYSPAAPPTEPDSASESLYMLQYFILRLYEIRPPSGDTASDSQ